MYYLHSSVTAWKLILLLSAKYVIVGHVNFRVCCSRQLDQLVSGTEGEQCCSSGDCATKVTDIVCCCQQETLWTWLVIIIIIVIIALLLLRVKVQTSIS